MSEGTNNLRFSLSETLSKSYWLKIKSILDFFERWNNSGTSLNSNYEDYDSLRARQFIHHYFTTWLWQPEIFNQRLLLYRYLVQGREGKARFFP